MRAVATRSWPLLTSSCSPPHCMKVLIWSTSAVTRETRAPLRSLFWVSTERSCTCRKALRRRVANPDSVARYRRRFIRNEQIIVITSKTAHVMTMVVTKPRSGPPGPAMPLSVICWTAMGTMTLPAVATRAKSSVNHRPLVNSGESSRPRPMVFSAPLWTGLKFTEASCSGPVLGASGPVRSSGRCCVDVLIGRSPRRRGRCAGQCVGRGLPVRGLRGWVPPRVRRRPVRRR